MMISRRSAIIGAGAVLVTRPARALVFPQTRVIPALAFPGGTPGYNSAHLASSPLMRWSVVAIPGEGQMLNLFRPSKPTVTGTVNSVMGAFGPQISPATAGYLSINGVAETPNQVTMACIVTPITSTASAQLMSNYAATGTNLCSFQLNSLVERAIPWNNNNVSSGFAAMVVGNTYFTATSYTSTTVYFVRTNLNTGQILTHTAASANTPGAIAGTTGSVGGGASETSANASISAAMYSASLLSPAQLYQWALAPWDFWYPQNTVNVALSGLKGSSSSHASSNMLNGM